MTPRATVPAPSRPQKATIESFQRRFKEGYGSEATSNAPCTCDMSILMTRGCPSTKGGKCPGAKFNANKGESR